MLATRFTRPAFVLAAVAAGLLAYSSPDHFGLVTTTAHKPIASASRVGKRVRTRARAHARAKHVVIHRAAAAPVINPPSLTGNISPMEIEIEQQSPNAVGTNLYPFNYPLPIIAAQFPITSPTYAGIVTALSLNSLPVQSDTAKAPQNYPDPIVGTGDFEDWVSDILVSPSSEPRSYNQGVATGIISTVDLPSQPAGTPVTGAAFAGTDYGHVNGGRIVDGIAGADQDIFLNGGKENDVTTWNVGPGSVGSSKYDATQLFIANSSKITTDPIFSVTGGQKNMLFFGMERRGNNGTTEFEFEFNVLPPATTYPNGSPIPISLLGYIPTRSDGDVLFTFLMNGSGTSGSCVPQILLWLPSGANPQIGAYVDVPTWLAAPQHAGFPGIPAGLGPIASINEQTTYGGTPSAPWGFVDSKGNWTIGMIPAFSAAKGAAYFGPGTSILPNLSSCGFAYVQVRTRASVTASSDLKDTTKIFKYIFGGPKAGPNSRTACAQAFYFDGLSSVALPANAPLTYDWTITISDPNVVPTGIGFNLTPVAGQPGVYKTDQFTTGAERQITLTGLSEAGADISAHLLVTENGVCKDSKDVASKHVYQDLASPTPTLTGVCNSRTISYSGLITGGEAPINYEWDIYQVGNPTPITKIPGTSPTVHVTTSGTFTPSADGTYYAVLNATDARFDPTNPTFCAVHPQSSSVDAYGPIVPGATFTGSCNVRDITYGATASGGKGPYTYAWTFYKKGTPDVQVGTSSNQGGTFTPTADGDYYGVLVVTDSHILPGATSGCTAQVTGNTATADSPMNPSAVKTSADGTALSVLVTGSYTAPANGQWQRFNATTSTWVDVSGQTGSTFTYSSFVTDDPNPTPYADTTDGSPFFGKIYHIQLRLKTTRTVNGLTCTVYSDPVTLKMLVAVDP